MRSFIIVSLYLILSTTLYSDPVWQKDLAACKKPILLHIDHPVFPGKMLRRSLQNSNVQKIIQEQYCPVRVSGLVDRDLVNRYGYIAPPSVAILSVDGLIVDQSRNLTPILMQKFLLGNYKSALEPSDQIKAQTERRFHLAYRSGNPRQIRNRIPFLEQKLISSYQFKSGDFRFTKPMISGRFYLAALQSGSVQLRQILHHQIDQIIDSKTCPDLCYDRARRGWDRPDLYATLRNNALFSRSLLHLYRQTGDKRYLKQGEEINTTLTTRLKGGYLFKNTPGREIDLTGTIEGLITRILYQKEGGGSFEQLTQQLKAAIKEGMSHRLLSVQIAALKGMMLLTEIGKMSIDQLIQGEQQIHQQYFNRDQKIYNDLPRGKEPLGFRWLNPGENIDLAIIQFQMAQKLNNPAYFISGKNILSFLQNIPGEHLLFTGYIRAYSLYDQLKETYRIFQND